MAACATTNADLTSICPLCGTAGAKRFHRDARRDYSHCDNCQLVFVPPEHFLSAAEEKACYDQHENDPADPRYRSFLNRLFAPLAIRLPPGARGLDFGSGPGPTLSRMLIEAGFPTSIYDPFYAPSERVWDERYDFVVASEVVEHLHQPGKELQRLWDVLVPGGWLGIMTKRVLDAAAFARWHYKNDPTHVAFFAEATFTWLATRWQAELTIADTDVVLLQKPVGRSPLAINAQAETRSRPN